MRVGVAADSHGDWASLDCWASQQRLDLVVHCGDAHATTSDGVPVISARGNHEQLPQGSRRPAYVEDYELRDIGGLRWLFLGCTSMAGAVAPPPADLPDADVLVTHEAPFNPHMGWEGHPIVRQVVLRARPRWCFSGHWHHVARGAIGSTTCLALGADPGGWLVLEVGEGTLTIDS